MGRKKSEFSDDSPTKDKQSPEEDLSATEDPDIDSDMEEATVTKTEEVDTRTSVEEEANEFNEIEAQTEVLPEKRGRGRPRKFPKKRAGDQMDHGENVVKKKRGRPRKYEGIANGTDKVSKSSKKSVPSVYLDTFDEEGYPQKRHGRPRKPQVVLTTDDNTNEEEYLEWYGEDQTQTSLDENVVKKKRGRPRKLDEVDYLEWYAEDPDESVVKKKRGRPRKLENGIKRVPKSKKSKKSIPRILLKSYVDDHYPQKRRGRPRKSNSGGHSSKNEARLGSQVDRLACLVDRLENRINLDGLIDEDTDIGSEQEIDKQIFLLQRNFNVKLDLKNDFKVIVKAYLEDLGAVQGCLIATVRSYKNSGRIVLFEIWESEAEQSEFSKDCLSRIFEKESSEMLKNNSVVKNMNIPARWWQRTR